MEWGEEFSLPMSEQFLWSSNTTVPHDKIVFLMPSTQLPTVFTGKKIFSVLHSLGMY